MVDVLVKELLTSILEGEFTKYCLHSIARPELITIAKDMLHDKLVNCQNAIAFINSIFISRDHLEQTLRVLLPDFPMGGVLKLTLLFYQERENFERIVKREGDIFPQHPVKTSHDSNSAMQDANSLLMKQLWNAWTTGKVKMDEFFQILGTFANDKRITLVEYAQAVDRILYHAGYEIPSSISAGSYQSEKISLSIPNISAYAVQAMKINTQGQRGTISIVDSKLNHMIDVQYVNNTELIADIHNLNNVHPVSSLRNIYWTLEKRSEEDLIPGPIVSSQGCKLMKLSYPTDATLIIIAELQKTRTSTLEINRILCVDGYSLADHPRSVQIALIVEGHYIGRAEDEWQSELSGDTNDAASEIAKMDTQNNSPNASGQDDNNNIIPDYSWKSCTYIIHMVCTEQYSIITSIVPLSETLLADQHVTDMYLQRNCAFFYGLHGLCAVHQFNKCFPRLRKVSLLVPDTTLHGIHPDQNEHRFHSHHSLVTTIDVTKDSSMMVSGDNEGKLCVWMAMSNSSIASRPVDMLPNFQLCHYYKHSASHQSRAHSDDLVVHMIRISPSTNTIVAAIGTQLLLLHRSSNTDRNNGCNHNTNDNKYHGGGESAESSAFAIVTPLVVIATIDTQEHSYAIYDVVFDQQYSLKIWRLSSPLQFHADAEQNFMTLSVWTHIDPVLRNLYNNSEPQTPFTPDCPSKMLDHTMPTVSAAQNDTTFAGSEPLPQDVDHISSSILMTVEEKKFGELLPVNSAPQLNNGKTKLTGFANIAGEMIPIAETVYLSLHPCTSSILVARSYLPGMTSTTNHNNTSNVPAESYSFDSSNEGHQIHSKSNQFLSLLSAQFMGRSHVFQRCTELLAVLAAAFQPPSLAMLSTALDMSRDDIADLLTRHLSSFLYLDDDIVRLYQDHYGFFKWIASTHPARLQTYPARQFWIDIAVGHNLLCAMYLRFCGNKSIAIEHPWQTYLQTYGPYHLRRSSRGLRSLTGHIRKIDETSNIKLYLPHQIGYIRGLQEIYARRVGLSGIIPKEIGELPELRVLSMGNNRLTGPLPASLGQLQHLQRIVLHQNNLVGEVPAMLGEMGCIVNLAGNPRLEYGLDVPLMEREALIELFHVTKGHRWTNRTHWATTKPVCKWYKVGVLSSHVHSLVMSSNNMDGVLPPGISRLTHLRMIELATMSHLVGSIPKELCRLTTLRRLCICRCGLTGSLPDEIGMLVNLEELQLFGNRLTGRIPSSVGNLTNLKLLSLGEYTGGNDFTPGYFPPCIERLRNLEALFLADCRVKGPLPGWIGHLTELRQLDLQRNQLTGPLPTSIGRLSNLLYLNIKDNPNLGGRLPVQELANLARLNRLSLVHCGFDDREAALATLRSALPRCKIWI